jgi:hypothetical protein
MIRWVSATKWVVSSLANGKVYFLASQGRWLRRHTKALRFDSQQDAEDVAGRVQGKALPVKVRQADSFPPKKTHDAYRADAVSVFGAGYTPDYYDQNFVGYMRRAYCDGYEDGKKAERNRIRNMQRRQKKVAGK